MVSMWVERYEQIKSYDNLMTWLNDKYGQGYKKFVSWG